MGAFQNHYGFIHLYCIEAIAQGLDVIELLLASDKSERKLSGSVSRSFAG